MPQTKARILRARITHISLVDRGANQVETLYKAEDDGSFEIQTLLSKSPYEEGLLTALVYLPEQTDAHGHIASREVIKGFCHDFFKAGGGNIDVMHDCKDIEGGAHVAESFIVQKGDPRFEGIKDYAGNPVNPEGSWGVIIKLESEDLRRRYRDGEFNGVSMFGRGVLAPTGDEVTKFQNALADRLGTNNQGVQEMNEEQMNALFEKFLKPINERLEKLEKPAVEPTPEQKVEKTEKIKFEGDPENAEDLAKHERKLMLAKCDLSTPEGLTEWREYLAKEKAEAKPEPKEETVEKSDELKKAEAEAASWQKKAEDLRKASKQATADAEVTLTADEILQKGLDRGKRIAQEHNKRLGRE